MEYRDKLQEAIQSRPKKQAGDSNDSNNAIGWIMHKTIKNEIYIFVLCLIYVNNQQFDSSQYI